MRWPAILFLFSVAITFGSAFAHAQSPSVAELSTTLELAENHAVSLVQDSDHWNMPLYMGANYVSQYYLMRFWLAQNPRASQRAQAPFDEARFRAMLEGSQLSDGSWQSVTDANLRSGNLDATIMNYWALKVMGANLESDIMSRARFFVVTHGGIEKASAFSRIVCALFGQLSWSNVPWTPMFFLNPNNPHFMNVDLFPQWVRPHIVPITYLRSLEVQRDLGPRFSIAELHAFGKRQPPPDRKQARGADVRWLIDEMLKSQVALGSWGGYTSATIFTIAAMDDYVSESRDAGEAAPVEAATAKGLGFIDQMYLNNSNPSSYLGSVCDGRYWDSILILQGLASTDSKLALLDGATDYLKKAQVRKGGIPFGLDFETTPDLDDTSELITTLSIRNRDSDSRAIAQAVHWLVTMQNSDGGWGAFDKNNVGNPIVDMMAAGLKDSATLFDPSTPDVTGHALEAFGSVGVNITNSPTVRRAVQYLRDTADDDYGTWSGRWGVNYIYGTNASISGLLRAGVSPADDVIQKPIAWLKSHQNADGGFGETTRSDLDDPLAGQGISTPSQTAWALMALVRSGNANTLSAQRAAKYLTSTIATDGSWHDSSVVGTGHSGIVYLVYPSYPVAFPMIALSEYQRALRP